MKFRVKRIRAGAKVPVYQHPGDAGMDLFAAEEVRLGPGEFKAVPTGIKMAIPKGHVGLIWDKSGISLQGVHRLAGVVDAGYRGEVKVVMINLGPEPYVFKRGQKVAQMLIQPVRAVEIVDVGEDDLDETARGAGGFGSTGHF
jgi:dUTP pyrophosphatase